MAQLLAGKAQQEVKEATAELDMSAVALKALLPDKTGFQLLTQPLMARGLGLRLKRNLFSYCLLLAPFQDQTGRKQLIAPKCT